jgi:sulfate permease, SulP family
MLRRIKQPTFAELYAPKLLTVLREGYRFADFRADVIAGLTVAIVALPLSSEREKLSVAADDVAAS